jgi:hypothetical protein
MQINFSLKIKNNSLLHSFFLYPVAGLCLAAVYNNVYLLVKQGGNKPPVVVVKRVICRVEREIENTIVPPYPRVIPSKTYRGYVKSRMIPNAIYKVIIV